MDWRTMIEGEAMLKYIAVSQSGVFPVAGRGERLDRDGLRLRGGTLYKRRILSRDAQDRQPIADTRHRAAQVVTAVFSLHHDEAEIGRTHAPHFILRRSCVTQGRCIQTPATQPGLRIPV